ncbi:hypothetical protein [Streptomyces sp. NPDC046832]|uniref:hypothetical protein n=1 Tax=Streptomyces sp. NPDC046832 TaxID=3155020 RepID=UPI0033CF4CE9
MTPATTSAFDLPDRLAHKAAPASIAADERHFAAIADCLEQSIADLSDRLEAARRAPAARAGTPPSGMAWPVPSTTCWRRTATTTAKACW